MPQELKGGVADNFYRGSLLIYPNTSACFPFYNAQVLNYAFVQ